MTKIIKLFYYLFFILIISLSCTSKKGSVQQDLSFDNILEIAKENNTPFCIVLTDSSQNISKQYLESIKSDYKYITEKSIFNIIDISSKKSIEYIQWLLPKSLPLTCVFSSNGRLIDLIPGAAKESLLYTDQAIEKQKTTEYHWPNSFQRNKVDIISHLAHLVNLKQQVNNYHWKDYEYLSDSLNYPYVDYLLLKNAAKQKDSTCIKQIAKRLLNFETSQNIRLYKDEFIEARKTINPNFSVDKAPYIRINNEKIDLTNLKVGKSAPLEIIIYNDGEELLRIDKINMSCTCVRLEGADEGIIIEGKKSYKAKFYITPEYQGELSREIFISSNALNNPNLHINIHANVNQ